MLCHGKSRGVVAYASQILTNATCETLLSFADVEMRATAAGDTVHTIFQSAGEMIADGEGALRAPYIGERSDELAGLTPTSNAIYFSTFAFYPPTSKRETSFHSHLL